MTVYQKTMTATVYVVRGNEVLLHWHKKYDTWFPLGGHIEKDEFPHEAAIREAREEAGIEISLHRTEIAPEIDVGRVGRIPAPFCIFQEEGRDEEFFDFIFIGHTDAIELHPDPDESLVFEWFSEEKLLHSDVKPHIKNTALAVLRHLKDEKIPFIKEI